MKRIAPGVLLAALFTSHLLQASCGPLPANGDVATLFFDLLDDSDATRECRPWETCWPRQFARAREAAALHPDDVQANLVYQAMALHLGPEDQSSLLDFYLGRARSEPTDATAQYLAAQLTLHAAEQIALLRRAVKLAPSFGLAYLDLAYALLHPHQNQDRNDLERELGTVEANLALFLRQCPQDPGAALQLNEVGDAAFWQQNLPQPRRAIEAYEGPRGLWRYLDALENLWALEQRLDPRQAKERLAADLAFLQRLAGHYAPVPLPILEALASAHHRLAQFKEEEELRDRILARFSCTSVGPSSAFRIRGERYWMAHGGSPRSPLQMPAAEAREYYAEVRSELRACPDLVALALHRELPAILRLGLADALTPAELARDERYFKALWRKVERFDQVYSLEAPGYVFPLIKLEHGRSLDGEDVAAIRSLIRYQGRWNHNRRLNAWTDDELPDDQEADRVGQAVVDVQLSSLLARALVRRKRPAEARAALSSIATEVGFLTSELDNKRASGVRVALAQYWRAAADVPANASDQALAAAAALAATATQDQQPAAQDARWRSLSQPIPLPALALHDLAGRTLTLDDLKGRTALLNVWATWCGPCQLELPFLAKVATQAAEDPRLLVWALSVDTDQGAVEPYLARRPDLHLPVVLFGEKYFQTMTADPTAKRDIPLGVPQTWLVKDGKILALMIGFDGRVEPDTWVKDTLGFLRQAAAKP
jgi:thiol-disulfide isomerase/thioredoxin